MLLNLSFACGSFSQVIWNGFFPHNFLQVYTCFLGGQSSDHLNSVMTPSCFCIFNLNINGVMLCLPAAFLKNLFIYLFLVALGLRCCVQAFSSLVSRGHSLLYVGFSLQGFPCCYRLKVHGLPKLQHSGSVVVTCGFQ